MALPEPSKLVNGLVADTHPDGRAAIEHATPPDPDYKNSIGESKAQRAGGIALAVVFAIIWLWLSFGSH